MAIINVENAQIKTAGVEIKTLTVSGKQVTLSVFRQIKEECIIDFSTMTLKGVPWGVVNYYFGEDKNCNTNNSFNLVWQVGRELRRCVMVKDLRHYQHATIYSVEESNLNEIIRGRTCSYNNYDTEWKHINCIPYLKDQLGYSYNEENKKKLREKIEESEACLQIEMADRDIVISKRDAELQKLKKHFDTFEMLPHLFIAI